MSTVPRASAARIISLINGHLSRSSRCSRAVEPELVGFRDFLEHALSRKALSVHHRIDPDVVFANNYLNFEDVKVVGFDMDYTLVQYTTDLQDLIYTLARDMLTSAYGYPQSLQECVFDKTFAIRGLSVDKKNGVLCKMSQMQRVNLHGVYKGKRALRAGEIEKMYGESRHISYGSFNDQMRPLNDLFAMAEGCLIADSIAVFECKRDQYGEEYSAGAVVDDVQAAIAEVHTSGVMHSRVMDNMAKYIIPSQDLASTLQHLKNGGKDLFMCTNSGCQYTATVLAYALGLPAGDTSWKELFDVIICSAKKPSFFSSNRRFRKWSLATNGPSPIPVKTLDKGQMYINGSAYALRKARGWSGKNIMYVGDNLWADLVEARRSHGWQTACLINELEPEILIQNTEVFQDCHLLRSSLRKILIKIQPEMELERKSRQAGASTPFLSKDCIELLKGLEDELRLINRTLSTAFNPYFGSFFRTEGNLTIYAFAMRR